VVEPLTPPPPASLTPRAREIVSVARDLLDEHGAEALTMRRIAERLGIQAPSLYKHLPDKATLEAAVITTGLEDLAVTLEQALDTTLDITHDGEPLTAIASAYRAFALAHPHLYLLMTNRPLPRERLPAGVEDRAAAPLLRVIGDLSRARAFWALAHGLVLLELAQRLPAGADIDAAWREGIDAFRRRTRPGGVRATGTRSAGSSRVPRRRG
jgi:AcrR family transcriptional regulator